jgi:biotin operon repressor
MRPVVLTQAQHEKRLQEMLKALADPTRLHLLRLMHERQRTVGDLAEAVGLTEPTVSHHLTKLREAGLANLRMAGTQRFYGLNESNLQRFKQQINTLEVMPKKETMPIDDTTWIDALGWNEDEAQVLREYTVNGVLVGLPAKQKRLMPILRWLVTKFEVGRRYTELEVNDILRAAYPTDWVSLRRDLVDFKLVRREKNGSSYWVDEQG